MALFTSNCVIAETYTALLVRSGRDEATEFGRRDGADEAFAFDHHFAQRGLRLHPPADR